MKQKKLSDVFLMWPEKTTKILTNFLLYGTILQFGKKKSNVLPNKKIGLSE